jgi:hypothetical protein
MFDGGIRLSRNAVIDFITAQYAAGKRYEWNVDVHIRGNAAWIAFVNRSSITETSGTASRHLEDRLLAQHSGP